MFFSRCWTADPKEKLETSSLVLLSLPVLALIFFPGSWWEEGSWQGDAFWGSGELLVKEAFTAPAAWESRGAAGRAGA